MASIEALLDDEGRGTLTAELRRIFVANGCEPACHICRCELKVNDRLHLKAFFTKISEQVMLSGEAAAIIDQHADIEDDTGIPQVDARGKATASIDVMICEACSKANRKLPRSEANKLLVTAYLNGMIADEPENVSGMGAIAPPLQARYQRSGAGHYGGCMIVRKAGKPLEIVGATNCL